MNNNHHQPKYIYLHASGELANRLQKAQKHLTKCNLCPHDCQINRTRQTGFCRAGEQVVLASYGPHYGEEKPLVGTNGSGTIFFGYCNMRCVYCQNCELSFGGQGTLISNERLAEIILKMQRHYKCHNVNFVTPTHFIPNIIEAVQLAVAEGLTIPLVYNCGGYEKMEIIKLLEGVIDIYMPDFKYDVPERGLRYSGAGEYPQMVKQALKEMDRQVGGLKTDTHGVAYRGLIIRHLMLPGGLEDTKRVLDFISKELSPECLLNLMGQYYSAHQAPAYKELAKGLNPAEFAAARRYAKSLGLRLAQ